MKTMSDLKALLLSIDHRGYPAYRDTKGSYQFDGYVLNIEHVQADPFAPPSRLSVSVPGECAALPARLYDAPHKRAALEDHLLRLFSRALSQRSGRAGSGKSGTLTASRPGQEVLERTACEIDPVSGRVLARLAAGFPANGRSINAGELIDMLFVLLPECVKTALLYENLDQRAALAAVELAEDQQAIRKQLSERGLCAFVANGAILPRESGVSQNPLRDAVPFTSPASMEVALTLPHRGRVSGMGIPKGVTLIVGGGFHGKSTLLRALETGVYNHIAGDGRELVVTDGNAVKIRAEDGRSVAGTDISMFIGNLPGGRDTTCFSTGDASGSTSQAANVVEAMEAGSSLLLIDEDTCATNFMIRDELMQRVVQRDREPITPFLERVHWLYEEQGVSTILVAGSSGLFFHVADRVVQMDAYVPKEITAFAKQEAAAFPPPERLGKPSPPRFDRRPRQNASITDRTRTKAVAGDLQVERDIVGLRLVEQLADAEQIAALGYLLKYAHRRLFDGRRSLREVVDLLLEKTARDGLASLADSGYLPTDLALPRRMEIFACLNRYRGLRL